MRRISIVGLCFAAVLAFSVVAASSASALPQFYHCAEGVSKGELELGQFNTEAECEKLENQNTTGKWVNREFNGGEKESFTSTSGTSTLEPLIGANVVCKKDKDKGEITSGNHSMLAQKVVVEFEECERSGKECKSGTEAGKITTVAMMGTLGYNNNTEHKVAMILENEAIGTAGAELAKFTCVGEAEILVTGRVVGLFPSENANKEPQLNHMRRTFELVFTCATKGKQADKEILLLKELAEAMGEAEQMTGAHLMSHQGGLEVESCETTTDIITFTKIGEIMA